MKRIESNEFLVEFRAPFAFAIFWIFPRHSIQSEKSCANMYLFEDPFKFTPRIFSDKIKYAICQPEKEIHD